MRWMRSKRMPFMGVVSYSLYLWHEPLMLSLEKHNILEFKSEAVWPLSTIALITAGLFVAWLSYHAIEVPGQRLRRLLEIHRTRPPKRIWRSGVHPTRVDLRHRVVDPGGVVRRRAAAPQPAGL